MKILIIMDGFFPGLKYGGPPVSVDNFCSLVSEYECYVVTKNHDMGEKTKYKDISEGWNDRGNCKVLYLSDGEYGYRKFDEIIQAVSPNIIYLQSLFQRCILPCLILAKKYNIRVMLAPRGELNAGAFKKKYKKIPYIFLIKTLGLFQEVHFQSTSDEETEAINRVLAADKNKIHYLTNVPSIPRNNYECVDKISGEGRFVFLSRIHPKKNLISAIKYFKDVKGKVNFDIYGPLEDEGYWKECQKEVDKLPANISVKYCGLVSHDKVHKVFSKYDAFLFPTYSENYGHVIIEALGVGCPVIVSDQVPWTDLSDYNAGWAIPLSDPNMFGKSVQEIVNLNNEEMLKKHSSAFLYFKEKMNLNKLHDEYKSTLDSCLFSE